MRNLLNFIIKYHVLFLFVVLEFISLTFIIRYNNFHQVKALNSSNIVSGVIYEKYRSVIEYFGLGKINEDLARENAYLRQQLQAVLLADIDRKISLQIGENELTAISAKVINNSVNKAYNYITLNKGSKDGIKPDMGIICNDGVVGMIFNVSEHYSYALSLLNGRWSVNAKLQSSNYYGTIRWEGETSGVVVLEEIPYHVKVDDGEMVVTSGYSSTFPEGVKVGTVIKTELKEGDSFQKIWVQLSTDFKNLVYVEVVEKVGKAEQLELEAITRDE